MRRTQQLQLDALRYGHSLSTPSPMPEAVNDEKHSLLPEDVSNVDIVKVKKSKKKKEYTGEGVSRENVVRAMDRLRKKV